jgi:hypothetical protein
MRSAGAIRAREISPVTVSNELRADLRAVLIHPHHERHQPTTPSIAKTSSTHQRSDRPAGHRIP